MRRAVLPLLVALGLCLTGCGIDGDETAAIHGTWTARYGVFDVYETYYPDGTWDVYENDEPPHDWGTYTLEGGILTVTSADDAWCRGGVGVFEVTFAEGAEGADEFTRRTVSDDCTDSARGRISPWTKQTP